MKVKIKIKNKLEDEQFFYWRVKLKKKTNKRTQKIKKTRTKL